MLIEIRNHHAQARHPITKERLVDDAGEPVPLFPFLRTFYLDGHMIGQTGDPPEYRLLFTVAGLPDQVKKEISRLVCEEFNLDETGQVCDVAEGVLDDGEE